jgi:hypothetical protein
MFIIIYTEHQRKSRTGINDKCIIMMSLLHHHDVIDVLVTSQILDWVFTSPLTPRNSPLTIVAITAVDPLAVNGTSTQANKNGPVLLQE